MPSNLNVHKSWHVKSFRNRQKVWEAEQKQKQEDQKMAMLRRQYQEERELEKIRKQQETAGLRTAPKVERISWMYQDGSAASSEARSNQQMLGNVKVKPEDIERAAKGEFAPDPAAEGAGAAEEEDAAEEGKTRSDPFSSIAVARRDEVRRLISERPELLPRLREVVLSYYETGRLKEIEPPAPRRRKVRRRRRPAEGKPRKPHAPPS